MILGVVFDLDGTLIDSRADIVDAVTFTLRELGGPPRTPDEIASYVGDGARLLLARAFGLTMADRRLDEALETFLAYYGRHGADKTTLMPGTRETLESLSALPLSICTNKPRVATELVVARLGLQESFRFIVAGGDLPERKPHPMPLHHIASELGVTANALLMVGDGPQDVECGKAAGARTVGVLGGFSDEATLRAASPDAIVGSLSEVSALVSRWSDPERHGTDVTPPGRGMPR
jgi:phosphoglycolate phosphatase